MPIVSLKPAYQTPIITTEPKIESVDYKSTTVDASTTAISSLLAYVEGFPWTVNYYSQIITTDSDLKEQDIGEANLYQQYKKIKNLELRVSDPITGTQNTDTAQMTVGGSAIIYPFLVPNVGDMFVTEAGLGQMGIYVVKSVERKSFNMTAVYSIEFSLMVFVDRNSPRLVDLDTKTTQEYVFDKSRLVEGLAPSLQTKTYEQITDLKELYEKIVRFYFKTFYLKEYDTLVIPSQGTGIYDSFLVDFILKMVDTFDAYEIRLVRNYATDAEQFLAQDTFWTAMLNRDANILRHSNNYMALVQTKFFNYNSMFKGFRYSRLSYVVYPSNADFSIINPNQLDYVGDPLLLDYGVFQDNVFTAAPLFKPEALHTLVEAKTQGGMLSDILTNTTIVGNTNIPIINPILDNKTYILSSNFYSQTGGQTLLESLVSDYINRKQINVSNLLTCIKPYRSWGRLEQFYYLPMLIAIIKTAIIEAY